MKKIYIIVSYSGSMPAKFFRLVTREKYVHVSISLDKNLKFIYSFARKYIHFPLPGGLIHEDMKKNSDYFSKYTCKIYEIDITKEKYKQLKHDLNENYLKKQAKYKYNVLGLPFIKFNKVYHREYHYACSQFVSKLLIDNNILDFKKDYSIVRPSDFLSIKNLRLIFEGKIFNYFK